MLKKSAISSCFVSNAWLNNNTNESIIMIIIIIIIINILKQMWKGCTSQEKMEVGA